MFRNADGVDPGGKSAFDGIMETPDRFIILSTVEGETVLNSAVPSKPTRLRIWVNHPNEPVKVQIGLE